MKNRLLIFVLMFLLSIQVVYSQSSYSVANDVIAVSPQDKTIDVLSYMKGRSRFGLNFAPNIHIYALPAMVEAYAKSSGLEKELAQALREDIGTGVDELDIDIKARSKAGSFGMTFYYDFNVLPWMSISIDAGFMIGSIYAGIDMTMIGDGVSDGTTAAEKEEVLLTGYIAGDYTIVPYSIGAKFFPMKSAPWGFYVMPKIGGTYVQFTSVLQAVQDGANIYNADYDMTGHGMFLGVELGWHLQLFGELTKDLPIDVSLDIGIFDFRYYLKSWTGSLDVGSYQPLLNLWGAFVPTLGFSVVF